MAYQSRMIRRTVIVSSLMALAVKAAKDPAHQPVPDEASRFPTDEPSEASTRIFSYHSSGEEDGTTESESSSSGVLEPSFTMNIHELMRDVERQEVLILEGIKKREAAAAPMKDLKASIEKEKSEEKEKPEELELENSFELEPSHAEERVAFDMELDIIFDMARDLMPLILEFESGRKKTKKPKLKVVESREPFNDSRRGSMDSRASIPPTPPPLKRTLSKIEKLQAEKMERRVRSQKRKLRHKKVGMFLKKTTKYVNANDSMKITHEIRTRDKGVLKIVKKYVETNGRSGVINRFIKFLEDNKVDF